MALGKAAVFLEPYRFEIRELPKPPVESGGLLVKVTSSGICGSDLHYWRGDMKPIMPGRPGPVVIGHEVIGVVDTIGSGLSTDSLGRPIKEGDRVAYPYFFPCRSCYNCLRGQLNYCTQRFRFRASVEDYPYCSGGFAEYYYLPPGHFVFKVPDELPDEAVTPANCAISQVIYGLQRANVRLGDSVVIQGAGGLGINATAAAREMGAGQIIVIDGLDNRLEMARQCGADKTIDMKEYTTPESRIEYVKELTESRGADIVMEVVGYPNVVLEGLEMVRMGGTFVEIGNIWPNSFANIDISKFIWGGLSIIGTPHYDPYILPVALNFLARNLNKYPLVEVMSHKFPLEQIEKAFEVAEWSGKSETTSANRVYIEH